MFDDEMDTSRIVIWQGVASPFLLTSDLGNISQQNKIALLRRIILSIEPRSIV